CAACEQSPVATTVTDDEVATVIVGGSADDDRGPDAWSSFGAEGFEGAGGFGSAGGFGAPAPFSPAVMAAAVNGIHAALNPPVPPLLGMENIPASMRELASVQGGTGFLPEDRLAPRVLSAQNAWLTGDILHDVTTRGTAQRTPQWAATTSPARP